MALTEQVLKTENLFSNLCEITKEMLINYKNLISKENGIKIYSECCKKDILGKFIEIGLKSGKYANEVYEILKELVKYAPWETKENYEKIIQEIMENENNVDIWKIGLKIIEILTEQDKKELNSCFVLENEGDCIEIGNKNAEKMNLNNVFLI